MSTESLTLNFTNYANLEKYRNIIRLKINGQAKKINAEGSAHMASEYCQLRQLTSLEYHIQYNSLYVQGTVALCLGLWQLSKLKYLSLNINSNRISSEGAIIIFRSLRLLTNLVVLDLEIYYNQIQDEPISFLTEGLVSLRQLESLTLNLNSNHIKEEGANQLSKGISQLTNLQILKLQMEGNVIGNTGAYSIFKSIIYLENLQELQLNLQYNEIDKICDIELPQQKFLLQLTSFSLFLQGNNINEDQATYSLLAHLVSLKSLQLNFSCCQLQKKIFQNCSQVFNKLVNLENLALMFDQSNIESEELIKIFQSIMSLENLKNFSLIADSKLVNEELAQQIEQTLSRLMHLTHLTLKFKNDEDDFRSNDSLNPNSMMTEDEVKYEDSSQANFIEYIAKGIIKLKNLTSLKLDLRQIAISNQSLYSLNYALFSLKNLLKLSLNFESNLLDDEQIKYLCNTNSNDSINNIKDLSLKFPNNQLIFNGAKSISIVLSIFVNLESLNLNLMRNKISYQARSIFISISYLKNLKNLKLNFENTQLEQQEGIDLFQSLKQLNNLENLEVMLSHNKIAAGSRGFLKSLSSLKNLKLIHLSFDENNIQFFEFNEYNPFPQMKSFQVGLQGNNLDNQTVKSLQLFLRSLKYHQTLEKLYVNFDFNKQIDFITRSQLTESINTILLQ